MDYSVTIIINDLKIEIANFKRYADAEFFARRYWLDGREPYDEAIYVTSKGFIYFSMRD